MLVNVAILGFGSSAEYFHYPLIKESDSLDLKAIFDVNKERLLLARKMCSVPVYELSDLIDVVEKENIDCVIVISPSSYHYEQAKLLLTNRVSVIVDKPVCENILQFKELLDIAENNGSYIIPFHNRIFDDEHVLVKKIISDNLIGDIIRVDLTVSKVGIWNEFSAKEFNPMWRAEKKFGGGVWNDWGPHLLSKMIDIVGSIGFSVLYSSFYKHNQNSTETMCSVIIEGDNGVCIRICISSHEDLSKERYAVIGGEGQILVEGNDERGVVKLKTSREEKIYEYINSTYSGLPIYDLMSELVLKGEHCDYYDFLSNSRAVYDLLSESRP